MGRSHDSPCTVTIDPLLDQHVHMHQHVAHPPADHSAGVIDSISDTLLNAFSRVRKPDERFLAMREHVDKFEEGISLSERLFSRVRNRTNGEYFSSSLPATARACECI